MNIFSEVLNILMEFLKSHSYLSYLIIFLGAYVETVVGVGVVIRGEFFFLAGSILAGAKILNIWLVSLVSIVGGILGDNTSYFIGRKYGRSIFREKSRVFNYRNFDKGKKFFDKYGIKGIFIARLLGPLSWITPFLAGTYEVKYKRFLSYNIPGVIVGIGQFMIVGYFFGNTYQIILPLIQKYVVLIISLALFFVLIYLGIKRRAKIILKIKMIFEQEKTILIRSIIRHILFYIVVLILLYALILYLLFFIFERANLDTSANKILPTWQAVSEIKDKTSFLTYLSINNKKAFQPVNFIFISQSDMTDIFSKIGWRENLIFSEGDLSLKKFLNLTEQKILPVSDLYLNDRVEDFAFQEQDNSLLRREHIKLWKFGRLARIEKNVYLGSVSYDSGIDLARYKNFIVPLHEIDPNVDNSRDELFAAFAEKFPPQKYYWLDWGDKIESSKKDDQNFYTDGRVLVLEFN